ncbi:MAG TPA: carbohydrate ABC transporter permease [Acidimicrobiales bacterium]|nr:carbohydrate ABC transporter permease [Acidimicrobiales bacterium]
MTTRRSTRFIWQRYARPIVLPIGALAITGVMLLPIYFTAESSLEPTSSFQALSQSLVPSHFVLSNYRVAFDAESGNIITSLLIGLGAVALSIGAALPAAYGLTKLGYLKNRAIVSGAIMVLLVTQMVPGISLSLAFYKLFVHLHLLNSIAGLIIADSTNGMPFATLVLRAFMGSIPVELSDAAYVDGASEWRTFRSVVAPLAVPAIITAGLFVFLFAWGDFLYAYTLTAGGNVTPLTKGLLDFFNNNTVDWGGVLATVVLAAIPSGLILGFGQRYVFGGLRTGALKG